MFSKTADSFGFLRFLARRFLQDRCPQVAASLTLTTLLALVPFATIALAVLTAFPMFQQFGAELKKFLLDNFVPQAASKIITFYEQFSANAANLTAYGIAFLGATALALMFTIDRAFNDIWRVSRPRALLQRLIVYWAVLTLGPILLGISVSLSSQVVGVSLGYARGVPGAALVLLSLTPIAVSALAFFLLYLTVPNRYVPRKHALVGGVVAALLFELMKRGFAHYIALFPSYKLVYGAFASFPIFLLWLYLSWLVIVLGAEIAAALSYWRGAAWRLDASAEGRFHAALRALKVLYHAQRTGVPVALDALRKAAPIGLDRLEDLLERMARNQLVQRVGGRGYALTKRPDQIKLADVYRIFVLESDRAPAARWPAGDPLAPIVSEVARNVESTMERSLESIYSDSGVRSKE
jgi:membrane protein